MGWHRLTVETDAASIELVSDLLWRCGTAGIEEQIGPDGHTAVLVAGFEGEAPAVSAARTLRSAISATVRVEAVVDDGLDAWRAWATPERAGRFAITPPWCDPLSDGSEPLWIDPGRTFGSGSHPTTRLMVELVEPVVAPGDRVLDVGTGSGVLAVAAARCGAGSVTAIDIDAASPAVVAANAAANGVAEVIVASTTPLQDIVRDGGGDHNVVLANMSAATIEALAEPLVAATRPGGHLVLSGLLDGQWRTVVHTVIGAGSGSRSGPELDVGEVRSQQGWAAVVLHRRRPQ